LAAITLKKGEEATRKKSKIFLVFCVSKSAPCNSLQLAAVARSPSQKNADSGCIPPVSGGGAGSLGNFSDPGNLNAVNA
jgi:hypothetical protein